MKRQKNSINQTIIVQLRKLRTDHDCSQYMIAEELGISQTTYCRYETGAVHISAEHLYQLSCFYDVDMSLFFGETKKMQVQENELQQLRLANEVLARANRQLIEGNRSLESDFIQQMVEFLIKNGFQKSS